MKALIEKEGRKVTFFQADLEQKDSINNIVNGCLDEYGKIDILVNNAGTIRRSPLLEYTEKDWSDVIDLNLNSLYFLSQEVAKVMAEQRSGKIINVASLIF